jgi:hypothetical protein
MASTLRATSSIGLVRKPQSTTRPSLLLAPRALPVRCAIGLRHRPPLPCHSAALGVVVVLCVQGALLSARRSNTHTACVVVVCTPTPTQVCLPARSAPVAHKFGFAAPRPTAAPRLPERVVVAQAASSDAGGFEG